MTRRRPRLLLAVALVGIGAGCARRVDLEQVPIGTRVDVTRQDGGVVRGTLTARDGEDVRMTVGSSEESIPRGQITDVELVNDAAPARLPAAARFRAYTVPAGTVLNARLNSSLGSDTSRVGDVVEATLTDAAVADEVDMLPAGSVLTGVVTAADPSGNVSGRADLAVRFRSISISVSGRDETYPLSASLERRAASTTGDDAKTIGIPAAGGAILGAILGGKKGAGIGALIGGGAGTAVVLTTSGPDIHIARGTALALTIAQAIDVRMPIRR